MYKLQLNIKIKYSLIRHVISIKINNYNEYIKAINSDPIQLLPLYYFHHNCC